MNGAERARKILQNVVAKNLDADGLTHDQYIKERDELIALEKERANGALKSVLKEIYMHAVARRTDARLHTFTQFERRSTDWYNTPLRFHGEWAYAQEMTRLLKNEGFKVRIRNNLNSGSGVVTGWLEVTW